jgi:hypothetical protein
LTKPNQRQNTEYSTNGSTGQREKAPAEPMCLITLVKTSEESVLLELLERAFGRRQLQFLKSETAQNLGRAVK